MILSAGAIGSPKILLLSGIGDTDELKKAGVKVQHHLPDVGRNLQDHLMTVVQHALACARARAYPADIPSPPVVAG